MGQRLGALGDVEPEHTSDIQATYNKYNMQHNNSVVVEKDLANEELMAENVFEDDDHYLNEELLGQNARYGVQELTTSNTFATQDMRNPYINPSALSM